MRCLLAFKTAAVALLTIMLTSACRTTQPKSSVPAGAAQTDFKHLERLVGRWTCTVAGAKAVELAYRLVSSGSALVETFTTPSGKETLTLFHLDDSHVLATHYCGQGNQPRLRLQQSSESTFDFRFQDATNLTSQDVSHLDRLELKLIDGDHYEKTETYVADGKEETTRFLCERVR